MNSPKIGTVVRYTILRPKYSLMGAAMIAPRPSAHRNRDSPRRAAVWETPNFSATSLAPEVYTDEAKDLEKSAYAPIGLERGFENAYTLTQSNAGMLVMYRRFHMGQLWGQSGSSGPVQSSSSTGNSFGCCCAVAILDETMNNELSGSWRG